MTTREQTAFRVLAAISFSHLLNDTIQSLLPAIYPILKSSYPGQTSSRRRLAR